MRIYVEEFPCLQCNKRLVSRNYVVDIVDVKQIGDNSYWKFSNPLTFFAFCAYSLNLKWIPFVCLALSCTHEHLKKITSIFGRTESYFPLDFMA